MEEISICDDIAKRRVKSERATSLAFEGSTDLLESMKELVGQGGT